MVRKSWMAAGEWSAPIPAAMAFAVRAFRPSRANLWHL
jgi:hypothetical protein